MASQNEIIDMYVTGIVILEIPNNSHCGYLQLNFRHAMSSRKHMNVKSSFGLISQTATIDI